MDIQAEKLHLIKWLADINEPSVIKLFVDLKKEQEADWWDTISVDERADIEEGLSQADRGELIPHDEVMAKYDKRRSK
ncbi:hypothetical protein [uncultured Mucilaginibacter sp.]|uniref:hypothetical protein n=1 Tax=uncultured Mucilaginibacter sp. TaxID=797541 RepID=UPI0025E41E1C|nr:hypothetical protein [uncultured Mucilaginibacter sp.]